MRLLEERLAERLAGSRAGRLVLCLALGGMTMQTIAGIRRLIDVADLIEARGRENEPEHEIHGARINGERPKRMAADDPSSLRRACEAFHPDEPCDPGRNHPGVDASRASTRDT